MKKLSLILILLTFINASPTWAAPIEVKQVSLINDKIPKNAVRAPFLRIMLSTNSQNEFVKSLTIGRTGLSTNEDLGRIWAETDQYRRSNARQLTNDDQVELTFRSPLPITPEKPQWLTIYANIDSSSGNRTIGLSLLQVNREEPLPLKTEPKVASPKVKTKPQKSSKATYDRKKFRIRCKNSRCKLVPRT